MKTSLIFLGVLVAASAWAVNKKPELRQGTKAVNKNNLDDLTNDTPSGKTLSHETQASLDKTNQLDSKRSRQNQEERPVTKPKLRLL